MAKEVIWSLKAMKQLSKAYDYIFKDSPQNVEKVKREILESTGKLSSHAEIHPQDKYRQNNDGSFRAYELHRYRIAYRVTIKEIIIVRFRHTKMEPKQY